VRRHFDKFVLLIIFVSLLPVITQVVKVRFQRKPVVGAGD